MTEHRKTSLSSSTSTITLVEPGTKESPYNNHDLNPLLVVKRSGHVVPFSYVELEQFLEDQINRTPHLEIDVTKFVEEIRVQFTQKITTRDILTLCERHAAAQITSNYNFSMLAVRIARYDLDRETSNSYMEVLNLLRQNKNPDNGDPAPRISDDIYAFACKHMDRIQSALDYTRDDYYDHFAFRTLRDQQYLLYIYQGKTKRIVERPQHMLMRVALETSDGDIELALSSYELLSKHYYVHGTPTLQNAGTPTPQMSSCFLVHIGEDSIEGMYGHGTKEIAKISAKGGGIGFAITDIRAINGYIQGTGGRSSGLMPYLQVLDKEAQHVDQGGGKRKAAISICIEPQHPELLAILDAKTEDGPSDKKTRSLFYHLWIPDLFMKRVKEDGKWSFMCPNVVKGLSSVYGEEFERRYIEAENKGTVTKSVSARWLFNLIIQAQIESGGPFMCYKDAANRKSNQKNVGVTACANLCTEIMEFTSKDETAVCNLISMSLKKFVKLNSDGSRCAIPFDFKELFKVARHCVKALNGVINRSYYPTKRSRRSNMRHRPIAIGIQGLADVFFLLRYPFTSPEAKALNRNIAEVIYFGAMTESMEQAKLHGPYETFPGSPTSKGEFQFDLWGVTPSKELKKQCPWLDWESLKEEVMKHGIRNSLLVAPMPTATTSQILGNYESFEPINSNIFVRRVLSIDQTIVNKYLVRDLIKCHMYNQTTFDQIIKDRGSVQNIKGLPAEMKQLYKTVWEISQKDLIDMAADRGPYVDQSQSLNIHMDSPTKTALCRMHMYGWEKGLKTGMYYLRTRTDTTALQLTAGKKNVAVQLGINHLVPNSIKKQEHTGRISIDLKESKIQEQEKTIQKRPIVVKEPVHKPGEIKILTGQTFLVERFTAVEEVCVGGSCSS